MVMTMREIHIYEVGGKKRKRQRERTEQMEEELRKRGWENKKRVEPKNENRSPTNLSHPRRGSR